MAGLLSPIGMIIQLFSDQGVVGDGFQVFTYVGGTVDTPVTTYTDSTLTVPNSNPIVMGPNGRFQSVSVWAPAGTVIKMVIWDASNNPIVGGTIDNIPLINDASNFTPGAIGLALWPQSAAEIAAGVTPTNYAHPWGSFLRYGADPTGINPSDTAIQNCVNSNSDCFDDYPGGGTYTFTTGITITSYPVTIRGQARYPGSNSGQILGTKFLLSTTTVNARHITLNTVYGLRIQNIGFRFFNSQYSQYCIWSEADFRYSIIEGCAFTCTPTTNNSNGGIYLQSSSVFSGDVVIRDNFFDGLVLPCVIGSSATTIKIYGNEFYGYGNAGNGTQGSIQTFTITGGSGYTNGTYNGVVLSGGSGTGAEAQIVVSGGVVTQVTLVTGGTNYKPGDTGVTGTVTGGTGWSITVSTTGDPTGIGLFLSYPVTGPVISDNYFEGFTCGIYSFGAANLKQIGTYYAVNVSDFLWTITSYARMWNTSVAENFSNGQPVANQHYLANNSSACFISSYGINYQDNSVYNAGLGFQEQLRAYKLGFPQAVAYSGGNFTASGSLTWTVSSGGQTTYEYSIAGKTLTVWFAITGALGGSASTALQIAIPQSFTAAALVVNPILTNNNSTLAIGYAEVVANGSVINCYNSATGANNWATTGNGLVYGSIQIPVN